MRQSSKKFNKAKLAILLASAGFLISGGAQAANPNQMTENVTYQNMFISYFTPNNVTEMVRYAQKKNLGGLLMWTFRGDTDASSPTSLLKTAVDTYQSSGKKPYIMGYWTNWGVYSNNPDTRAIPEPSYPVPGSSDGDQIDLKNADFSGKLEKMNVVAYAFLDAQGKKFEGQDNPNPSQIGTLYFNDPWADLAKSDVNGFCQNGNPICSFVPKMRGKTIDAFVSKGNFTAFAKLNHSEGNPLGKLKKVISIGGYDHDNAFEDAFAKEEYMDNFANSAAKIIKAYDIDGIDLDYENPSMTHEQSMSFLKLVNKLKSKFSTEFPGKDILITVTILSNPEYLKGTLINDKGEKAGFKPGVLAEMAKAGAIINLMTYDFHGAFDYDGKEGKTGFLTNTYKAFDAPKDTKFSVEEGVDATLNAGVPSGQVNIGIPAYGRALAGIPKVNDGLYQVIPSSASIPRGDMDAKECGTGLPLTHNACSGGFQYKYIVASMLDKGFTQKEWKNGPAGVSNGTTAYADSWSPSSDVGGATLLISNTGGAGYFGLVVKVGDFWDYRGPATSKEYSSKSNPSITPIDGKKGLTVHWSTYDGGPQGDCPMKLDVVGKQHVMIRVKQDGKDTACDITPVTLKK